MLVLTLVMKFISLHHATAIAATRTMRPDEHDGSHLCHHTTCKVIGHVVWEPSEDNQRRKGCAVWVDCPHCNLKVWACVHEPKCIRFIPGITWDQYQVNRDAYFH